jgi:hypothetical protein
MPEPSSNPREGSPCLLSEIHFKEEYRVGACAHARDEEAVSEDHDDGCANAPNEPDCGCSPGVPVRIFCKHCSVADSHVWSAKLKYVEDRVKLERDRLLNRESLSEGRWKPPVPANRQERAETLHIHQADPGLQRRAASL